MKQWILGGASALALSLTAGASWSLTAEEAWAKYQEISANYGYTVSAGGQSYSGGVLTLTDVSYGMNISGDFEGEVDVTMTTAEVVLTEQGSAVQMTSAPETKIAVMAQPEGEPPVDVKMTIAHPGLTMTLNDAGGGFAATYTAPSMVLTMDSITVEGVTMDGKDGPFQMTATFGAANGNYTAGPATPLTVTGSANIASMLIDVDARNPDGEGTFNFDMSMANLISTSTTSGGPLSPGMDFPAMLKAGFATQGTLLYGPTTFKADFKERNDAFNAEGASNGGQLTFKMDQTQILYNVLYNAFNISMSGSEIPLPVVKAAFGELGTNVLMPLQKTEAPQPFVVTLSLKDLTIGEEVWSLFDPAAVLPRDPATLVIDLAGQARWLVDLMDPEAMQLVEQTGGAPGEIHALSISDLQLKLAGADLTGNGSFQFDNSDTSTFNGLPKPTGSVDLKLVGGNGLMDKLVQMGLLPEDQAMMGRMMAGMLAKPGDGPDTLISNIAITPDGQVLANGAPLPF